MNRQLSMKSSDVLTLYAHLLSRLHDPTSKETGSEEEASKSILEGQLRDLSELLVCHGFDSLREFPYVKWYGRIESESQGLSTVEISPAEFVLAIRKLRDTLLFQLIGPKPTMSFDTRVRTGEDLFSGPCYDMPDDLPSLIGESFSVINRDGGYGHSPWIMLLG